MKQFPYGKGFLGMLRRGRLLHGIRIIVSLLLILMFGDACQSSYTRQFTKSDANYGSRIGIERNINDHQKLYGSSAQGGNGHHNQLLRFHNRMSLAVSELPGVYSAVVLTTDQNAYAAVILDSTGTGNLGEGNKKQGHHIGTTRGMYDWPSGREDADPNEIATGKNSYFTAEKPADLSNLFKQRVASTIRRIDPSLKEVYISANRNFINQLSVYREEARRGVDLSNYLSDFNRQVQEHFQDE